MRTTSAEWTSAAVGSLQCVPETITRMHACCRSHLLRPFSVIVAVRGDLVCPNNEQKHRQNP
eukprot:m.1088120 g.1088120  ORF g.1088120 m.1088120 type:complete len:62 (-) comp24286_c0_seq8:189-374(-)